MPLVRSRGFRRGSGRPLRPMEWTAAATTSEVLVSAGGLTGFWVVLPSQVHARDADPTVMRTILSIQVAQTTAGTAFFTSFGIIKWNSPTDAVPALVPNPDADADGDDDWLIHGVALAPAVGTSIILTTYVTQADRFDSKARRRMDKDSGLLFVAENDDLSASTARIQVYCRTLLKM